MQKENSTKGNPGQNEKTIPETEEKIFKIRFQMMGKEGIVNITMDNFFTYPGAIDYLKENMWWMQSATILKVKEVAVGVFTRKDFPKVEA